METGMTTRVVTVFGGSGFLGRHVVSALARTGCRLRVAVRHPHTAYFLGPLGRVGQIQIIRADITDEESVRRALAGADAVVNLVGVLYERGRQNFSALHAEGAERVARLARQAQVRRLVHVSALGADVNSLSRYARSKAEGEQRVAAAFPGAVILRPSLVFGPEDAFFNRFAALARLSPCLPLIGGGHTRFQPVYVGDVAAAVTAVLETAPARAVFELGGPGLYTFKELLAFILEVTGRRRVLVPVPFGPAKLMGAVLGLWPKPLLTRDQVLLLMQDNVVTGDGACGVLADLGITPQAVEAIVPAYLVRFRPHGQFDDSITAALPVIGKSEG